MTDVLKHLRAALFLNAEARMGSWGLSFDLVYCDFSKSSSQVTNIVAPGVGVEVPLNSGTTTDLTGSMLSLMGSYALRRSSNASFDLLAGVRYTHIAATLDWNFTMSVASSRHARGRPRRAPTCGRRRRSPRARYALRTRLGSCRFISTLAQGPRMASSRGRGYSGSDMHSAGATATGGFIVPAALAGGHTVQIFLLGKPSL